MNAHSETPEKTEKKRASLSYNAIRRKTTAVRVGGKQLGGGAPIAVQSMTNTKGFDATLAQMRALRAAGCDIVRMAVPDGEAVKTLARLKEADVQMPIVADIHFDYRLALAAADAGADKIRLNPGNIGGEDRIKAVAKKCREKKIPIRVGVNSGSLQKELLAKYGTVTPEALAESALENARLLEKQDFYDLVIAVKSSSPYIMAEANRLLASRCAYPLHLGVTEAGTPSVGLVKGAAGIGGLLLSGIGDTIRVSLTADPVEEVRAGIAILRACGFYDAPCVELVSCPTCGRTEIDLIAIAGEFEKRAALLPLRRSVKAAIMGCVVNGPGEAADADVGIAGGRGEAVLFKNGVILRKIPEEGIVDVLLDEVARIGSGDGE